MTEDLSQDAAAEKFFSIRVLEEAIRCPGANSQHEPEYKMLEHLQQNYSYLF